MGEKVTGLDGSPGSRPPAGHPRPDAHARRSHEPIVVPPVSHGDDRALPFSEDSDVVGAVEQPPAAGCGGILVDHDPGQAISRDVPDDRFLDPTPVTACQLADPGAPRGGRPALMWFRAMDICLGAVADLRVPCTVHMTRWTVCSPSRSLSWCALAMPRPPQGARHGYKVVHGACVHAVPHAME